MHFEILSEDQSGKKALDILMPRILGPSHGYSFRIISYKGIGHVPKNMRDARDPSKRILLENLPRLLKGYGNTFRRSGQKAAVIVVCDLDDRQSTEFLKELHNVLYRCNPRPDTRFCLAIEEGEAWFLGDISAIKAAYPRAKNQVIASYRNDSICGTWERLADAIYPGGAKKLVQQGWRAIGRQKIEWAEKISPRMNPSHNKSPSFCDFRNEVLKLATSSSRTP